MVVEGTIAACREFGVQVTLVGPQAIVAEEVRRAGGGDGPISIVDAPDSVAMAEKVSRASSRTSAVRPFWR